jgi:hypothetical protein
MENQLYIASLLANILDNQFNVFGFKFGVSAIIDLIPGLGDIFDLLLSCYIVWLAVQMHIPKVKIINMLWNVLFSFLVGLVPLLGDAAYIFYKPNIRNLTILKKYANNIIEGEIVK